MTTREELAQDAHNRGFLPVALAWALLLLLPCIGVTQTADDYQIQSAQATDQRIKEQVAAFRTAVLTRWGDNVRFGRLQIEDSRIRGNVFVGGALEGVVFSGGTLEVGDRHLLDEFGESALAAAHRFSLSVISTERLDGFLSAARSEPEHRIAHLYRIELAYFPAPVDREVAGITLMGFQGMIETRFDLSSDEVFDLDREMTAVATARKQQVRSAAASTPSDFSGLVKSLPVAVKMLQEELGVPLALLGVSITEDSITFAVPLGKKEQIFWNFDQSGLREGFDMSILPGQCKKAFTLSGFDPGQVAELIDTAVEASPLPGSRAVGVEIHRPPNCKAPAIAFEVVNERGYVDVVFDTAGRLVSAEVR